MRIVDYHLRVEESLGVLAMCISFPVSQLNAHHMGQQVSDKGSKTFTIVQKGQRVKSICDAPCTLRLSQQPTTTEAKSPGAVEHYIRKNIYHSIPKTPDLVNKEKTKLVIKKSR